MTTTNWLAAVILGVVEGATEFLPVSSTGHLIAARDLLALDGARWDTFLVFIQIGAILAAAWDRRVHVFGPRHLNRFSLAVVVMLGTLPAGLIGLLAYKSIKAYLFSSTVVAWALILGAGVMLVVERYCREPQVTALADLTPKQAVAVGFYQCLAMIPGASRAAATILGGMTLGLSRAVATEFSFLVAIPTIGAAALYDLYKSRGILSVDDIGLFATGTAVSFVVALVVVRWLLGYVRTHDFRWFAAWRVVLGVAILGFGLGK